MPQKHKTTKSWDALMDNLEERHSKRFDALLVTMDDDEFTKNYLKILEFAKAKKNRQEIISETTEERTVFVNYVNSESDGAESFNGISED